MTKQILATVQTIETVLTEFDDCWTDYLIYNPGPHSNPLGHIVFLHNNIAFSGTIKLEGSKYLHKFLDGTWLQSADEFYVCPPTIPTAG